MLTAKDVCSAILEWPGLYETEAGEKFSGMPVSQVSSQLIICGWRNVSHLNRRDFEEVR